MNRQDELDNLIYKIYKFTNQHDRIIIKNIILDTPINNLTKLKSSIKKIENVIFKYFQKLSIKRDEHRQDFITEKIMNFVNKMCPDTINQNMSIVDIGGGNGDVISLINTLVKGNSEQFICVETATEWVESYAHNHDNIVYKFWNNDTIDVVDNSCDIVMCMVSLHHMNDLTIANALKEMKRILKENGILLIKEHDSGNTNDCRLIHWEHHLYHILDCAYENKVVDVEEYMTKLIHNFHSKQFWRRLFEENGFKFVARTNRFLDGPYVENDKKNPTKLYWDAYRK